MTRGSTVAVRDVHKRYGATEALAGLHLFAHGGVTTLLGPNGAGKTTLLKGLATVHRFDDGLVQIDGMDPTRDAERTEIRRRLGYLPQDPGFHPNATAYDALDYLAVLKGHEDRRRRAVEVSRVLSQVGLAEVRDQKVKTLSGGMKRRLGVAQAMLGSPTLVLLDEPAAGLDPEQRLLLREQVSRLGETATVLVSTHLTDEAAAMSQSVHVLSAGRIVFSGTPTELTATAAGRVWRSEGPPASSGALAWRTSDGSYRGLGEPPPGVTAVDPTVEDAYLLLVGLAGRTLG